MVLKTIHILVLIGILFTGVPEGRLLSQYKPKIKKKLIKIFESSKKLHLKTIETSQLTLELYRVHNQSNELGYLALREVKACSLNGCSARDQHIPNLASEYYDIAVFINEELKINQIIVLDYFSDYGYEISSTRYLKQYQGKQLQDFSLEHPMVDGISGATISYDALIVSLEEIGRQLPVNQ